MPPARSPDRRPALSAQVPETEARKRRPGLAGRRGDVRRRSGCGRRRPAHRRPDPLRRRGLLQRRRSPRRPPGRGNHTPPPDPSPLHRAGGPPRSSHQESGLGKPRTYLVAGRRLFPGGSQEVRRSDSSACRPAVVRNARGRDHRRCGGPPGKSWRQRAALWPQPSPWGAHRAADAEGAVTGPCPALGAHRAAEGGSPARGRHRRSAGAEAAECFKRGGPGAVAVDGSDLDVGVVAVGAGPVRGPHPLDADSGCVVDGGLSTAVRVCQPPLLAGALSSARFAGCLRGGRACHNGSRRSGELLVRFRGS